MRVCARVCLCGLCGCRLALGQASLHGRRRGMWLPSRATSWHDAGTGRLSKLSRLMPRMSLLRSRAQKTPLGGGQHGIGDTRHPSCWPPLDKAPGGERAASWACHPWASLEHFSVKPGASVLSQGSVYQSPLSWHNWAVAVTQAPPEASSWTCSCGHAWRGHCRGVDADCPSNAHESSLGHQEAAQGRWRSP